MMMTKMKMMIRMMKLAIYGSSHSSEDSCFAQFHRSFHLSTMPTEASGITFRAQPKGIPRCTQVSLTARAPIHFTAGDNSISTMETNMPGWSWHWSELGRPGVCGSSLHTCKDLAHLCLGALVCRKIWDGNNSLSTLPPHSMCTACLIWKAVSPLN